MTAEEDAAEAFGVLADPTRIAILRAFAEAMDEVELGDDGPIRPVLPFSEVYDRVDVGSTSQLSYHLEKLDGRYLRRTEDGWKFTYAGEAVVRFVLSGAYADDAEFDPVAVDGRCFHCGAESLRADVEGLVLIRECTACEQRMGAVPVTPAQLRDRDAASVLASTRTRFTSHFRRFREDVCPQCGGAVDLEVVDPPDDLGRDEWMVVGRCRQCWRSVNGPFPIWLANHPASVAFHWEHGEEVLSFGYREASERLAAGDWETDRVDSGEFEVTYRVDGAELRLHVDEELSVRSVERVRRDSLPES